ncbi:DUF4190 domain-containing protein [Nocardioides dilutus]
MSYDNAPPPPPPPGYGAQPPGYGAPQKTNTKAIWSLVTGILGLFCCPIILAVAAIILSRSAKSEIASRGEGGDGLATAGFVLGILGLVLGALQLILIATGNGFDYSFSTS